MAKFKVDKNGKVFLKGKECKKEKDIAKIIKGINKKGLKDIVSDKGYVYLKTGSGWVYIPGLGWFRV